MELTLINVMTLVFSLASLIIAIVVAARQGKNIDDTTAERLADMSKPEVLEHLKQAYQAASEERKLFVSVLGGIVSFLAPFTVLKSDDAAAALLKKIQSPDEAATVTTTTTTTVAPAAEPLPSAG